MIVRVAIVILAALGVLWFPWPLTLVLIIASGMVFPLSALVLGLTVDMLYHPFSFTVVPYGVLVGVAAYVGGTFVRRFVASRIMDA